MAVHTADRRADVRWLGRLVMHYRFAAVAALVYGAMGGLTAALEPYIVGIIVDHIVKGAPFAQVLQEVAVMLGLALITIAAFYGQRHYAGQIAYGVQSDARRTVFFHMMTLDQGFYEKFAVGDLIARVQGDLEWVWRLLAITFTRGGSAIVGLITMFVLLALVNVPLTIVVFITLGISTAFQMRAGVALIHFSERVQDQQGVLSGLAQDAFSGIQTLKTFGREADLSRRFYDLNLEYRRRWLFFKRRNEPVGMLPQMIAYLTTGMVVLFGGILATNGQITLGNFTQFLLYLGTISNVLLQIGMIYQRYQQTRGVLQRITPLLQAPEIADAPDARPVSAPKGHLRFENIGLQSEGKWLLRNITLDIPAGATVGIVGPTGCGKTLLTSLITRTMDPDEGRVLLDGQDIRTLQLDALRRAIAAVPQSTFLFSQPLHENVRMGAPDLSDDALLRAIHISRMSNDLPHLPQGLETLVGEKGVMLSGGQKQRVAIARAIARDPAVLILDDALSSVDTQTAADILAELRHVLKARTSLIIAHRIATVKDADFIVVMAEGHIVEQGTHEALIAQGGSYARMVERELREAANQPEGQAPEGVLRP